MVNLSLLLPYTFSVFCLITFGRCQLRPNGKNVKTKSEEYYVTEKTSIQTRRNRRTCTSTCTWWCWGRRRVCRTVYYSKWIDVYKKVKRTRPVYVCIDGWAPKGSECTTPICVGSCKNGGVCVSPNTCHCGTGWTGSRCDSDLDECKTGKNQCGYKPGCVNTQGNYTCTCPSGYNLNSDQKNCADIDECSRGQYLCGANMKCHNIPGNYSCVCLSGFEVASIGSFCKDIDECDPSSGVFNGCEMKCKNFPGGYNCSCDKGFFLTTDGKQCSDHDECKRNKHGCEQICDNVPGSYKCNCLPGYRLSNENMKSCEDINECSENISGCAHVCKNSIGGFNCSCRKGFKLGHDLQSCVDIDECSKFVDYCHHICVNTHGSYKCECKPGFDLQIDGKTCIGRACFPVYTPSNGEKNCSGYRTEDSCDFGCFPGYKLVGSKTRTCEPGKRWTGNNTQCKTVHCTSPVDPSNGFVYLPCATQYGSQCSVGCNDGYFTNTNILTCNASGIWHPGNISCTEIKLCQPNPCLNDGICSVVSEDQYTCDCTHTGYMGERCDTGLFVISNFPALTSNILSSPVTIISSRPTNYVVLHFISRELEFSPPSLIFKKNSPLNQSVRIFASDEGFYPIRFSLSGPDAVKFRLPEENIVFVNSPYNITKDSSSFNFPYGCHKKQLGTCPGTQASIIVSSTSPFIPFGPIFTTKGIVSVEGENLMKIPLSILGLNLPNSTTMSLSDSCNENEAESFRVESLVKYRSLAKLFVEVAKQSLPSWLLISLCKQNLENNIHSSELKTRFLVGKQLRESGVGMALPIENDMYYSLFTTNKLNITIQNNVDILPSSSLAMAVEVCGRSPANILLHPNIHQNVNPIDNISILNQIKKYGWFLNVSSIEISKAGRIKRPKKEGFWDGNEYFSVDASSNGTFALESLVRKDFTNSTFAKIRFDFDGTMVGDYQDVNQILNFPLNEEWNVDFYGRIALTILLKIQGKSEKILFDGLKGSIGYAGFGGSINETSTGKKKGIFFRITVKDDPFLNSSLKTFFDLRHNKSLSCFLNTRIYKEENDLQHVELTDNLNCVFHGILKVGALQFHPMQLNLRVGSSFSFHFMASNVSKSQEKAVQLIGKYIDDENKTFGIFKRSPKNCVNVRLSLAQRTRKYMGSFCAICNIFGIEKLVNITLTREKMQFEVSGKIHDLFDATFHCSSKLLSWENQVFDVQGRFEGNKGDNMEGNEKNNLVRLLTKELDIYCVKILIQAKKRAKAVDLTVDRAHARLKNVQLLRKRASDKLQKLTIEYASIKQNIEAARKYLESLEMKAANSSKYVKKLKSDLNSLCTTKQCPNICQEGISCTPCRQYIIANTMGTCPATCSATEQHRVPPYSEVAYCHKENCKRIHSTNGFFKAVFGETLGKIIKFAVSFAIKAIASPFVSPPAAAALAGGLTSLIDTGRPDEAICSAITSAVGIIGSLNKCERKQRDGKWNCRVETIKCNKGRYEYEYSHVPYICEKSCVIQKVEKTVEKTCCSKASCALFVVNVTCVSENVLCKKARSDAIAKIFFSKSQAENILKKLEDGRSNVSYWNMRIQKHESMLKRQRRWLNTTEKTIYSLQRAYNSSIESRKEINHLLDAPVRVIKSLLDREQTSLKAIKLTVIRFKAKVSAKRNDNHLLPIDITVQVNRTYKQISTVLDFERLNSSLKSISEEIISDVIQISSDTLRRKRSVGKPAIETDVLFWSMKKLHRYCAKFTNYHQILHNVATSLHKLSSEVLLLKETIVLETRNRTKLKPVTISLFNQTIAAHFGLQDNNYTHIDNLNNDIEMSEAIELQKEASQQNYQQINSIETLLVYNWWATMEDTFNSSRFAYECSGMNDCIAFILDTLVKMSSFIRVDGIKNIRQQVDSIERALEDLSHPHNITVEIAAKVSSGILTILSEMAELRLVCTQSVNITKHPDPKVDLSIGKDLILECNATGTALQYSWTFNGNVLQGQRSNVLIITNTSEANTGNYTCLVSNHIAKEKSTPSVVIIHPPPIIITQPVSYLAIVLSEDSFLNCIIKDTGGNFSYQWWFKSTNSSSFIALPNETFSYLDFSPMKAEREGMYFCQVSNTYGITSSRSSLVKAVSFTLPVPVAVLSFSLHEIKGQYNWSNDSLNVYEVISSHILKHILFIENISNGIRVNNLRPVSCQLERKSINSSNIGSCSWEFQYVGRNTTSNYTIYNDFKINTGMVINATEQVSKNIERFVNATNSGSLSFSLAGNLYLAERNSIAVQKFALTCPRTQALIQEDFKCVDCPPGYHATLNEKADTSCEPCPLGFYQKKAGKLTCHPCPKGYSTSHVGSHDDAQCKAVCKAGQFGTVAAGTLECLPCPRNMYQPQEAQFGCLPCPKNHITQLEGATKLEQCYSVLETTGESPTRTTNRTTTAVFNESDADQNDKLEMGLTIGLAVGFFFFIAIVIAIVGVHYRRSAKYRTRSKINEQASKESSHGSGNNGNNTAICAFQNAIYDGGSSSSETENTKSGDEICHSYDVDLKNDETGVTDKEQAEAFALNNLGFTQISPECSHKHT